jgi:hypothetical protein
MLLVLFGRPGEHEDVIHVGEAEVEFSQDVVHEALERLGGVSQAERHVRELEQAKGCSNGCLRDVVGVAGNLVICFHQVDFGKHGATGELVRVIMDVRDRVTVGDGTLMSVSLYYIQIVCIMRHK